MGGAWCKTMGDMPGGSNLGLKVELAGNNLRFSFTNGQMAGEFALLNGQIIN